MFNSILTVAIALVAGIILGVIAVHCKLKVSMTVAVIALQMIIRFYQYFMEEKHYVTVSYVLQLVMLL